MLLHSSEKAILQRINNLKTRLTYRTASVCALALFHSWLLEKQKGQINIRRGQGEKGGAGNRAAGSRRWTAQKALQYKWQRKPAERPDDVTEAFRWRFNVWNEPADCEKAADVQLRETCCRYSSETSAGNFLSHSKLKSRLQPFIDNHVNDKNLMHAPPRRQGALIRLKWGFPDRFVQWGEFPGSDLWHKHEQTSKKRARYYNKYTKTFLHEVWFISSRCYLWYFSRIYGTIPTQRSKQSWVLHVRGWYPVKIVLWRWNSVWQHDETVSVSGV